MASTSPEVKDVLQPVSNRAPVWVMPLARTVIILIDCLIAFGAFIAAFIVREGVPILASEGWAWSQEFLPYSAISVFSIPLRVILLSYYGAYRLKGAFSIVGETLRIAKSTMIGSMALVALAFMFRGGFEFREFSYSRSVFLLDFLLALLAYVAFHALIRFVQAYFRNRDINLIPTLIVGTNLDAERTIRMLHRKKALGYRVVGVLAANRSEVENRDFEGIPILGRLDDLPELARKLAIQEVVITAPEIPRERLFELLMESERSAKIEFKLAPSLLSHLPQKTSVEQIGVLPMVSLFREPLSDVERIIKRAFDVVISAAVLLLTLPLTALISLLVKYDSPGPVLFSQERIGMDGRPFLMHKFRTMVVDADDSAHRAAYAKNIAGDKTETASNEIGHGKVKNDPRITKIGRLLRRTSLDELPQFANVLRGDMSIVGPRPPYLL